METRTLETRDPRAQLTRHDVMEPSEVVGQSHVHPSLVRPGTAIAVRDDSPQVPVVYTVPTVERTTRVSLTGVLASLRIAPADLVVDVVVVVAAPGQDGDLDVAELLGAGSVLTEVSPASSNTGTARSRGHAGVVRKTDLLHLTVNVEGPVEPDQGDVVSQEEIVVPVQYRYLSFERKEESIPYPGW